MADKSGPRPGGRSARIQHQVLEAVKTLQEDGQGDDLSVPKIAAIAGVTASTIYRRWGDLQGVLTAVALNTLQADEDPKDTGSLRGDLTAWLEQYADELTTVPGRALVCDSVNGASGTGYCSQMNRQTIALLLERAAARQEVVPTVDAVMDLVVAPMVYRVLFGAETVTAVDLVPFLDRLLSTASQSSKEPC